MDKKDIIVNLKLIKALGKKHDSGELIVTRLNRFVSLNLPDYKVELNDALTLHGIEYLPDTVKDLGNSIARYMITPNAKKFVDRKLNELTLVCNHFTAFDKFIAYHVENGKIIYSHVSLYQGANVIDDLIKFFE